MNDTALTRMPDQDSGQLLRDFQMSQLTNEIRELKDRVTRLESTITKGLLLLVANLAGVAASVGQQVLQ
jgi:hypothetical protein